MHFICDFRAPAQDLDSSSSSIELDASFQRQLERKREMTNKENSHPIAANSTKSSYASGSGSNQRSDNSQRGMPLGEIMLDHCTETIRNIPSWILDDENVYAAKDNTISFCDDRQSKRHEYSEINRMLANCDINVNEEESSMSTSIVETIETNSGDTSAQLDTNAMKTENKSLVISADDTLEEIEYDKNGQGLHYVPVKKSIENENADDIIVIESSPENSFVTARGHMDDKSLMTNANDTFVTTNNMSLRSGSSNSNLTKTSSVGEFYTVNNLSINTTARSSQSNANGADSATVANESFEAIPEFDTTLERIEYILEQAKQMQEKTVPIPNTKNESKNEMVKPVRTPKTIVTTAKNKSIGARTPIGGGTPVGIANASDALKLTPGIKTAIHGKRTPIKSTTPSSGQKRTPANSNGQKKLAPPKSCTPFKKPEARASPLAGAHSKPAPPSSCSKIPTMRGHSVATKLQFRHIASPIATYIKNTAEVPLLKTVRPANNKFFNPNLCGRPAGGNPNMDLDSTVQSKSSTTSIPTAHKKTGLPRKVFKCAAEQQVCSRHMLVDI